MRKTGVTLPPIHPGAILRDEFLEPFGLSVNKAAMDMAIPSTRLWSIVNEKRSISADTALRLSIYFGATPQFWQNLQSHYELLQADAAKGEEIKRKVQRFKAVA